jgi:hypothetical protein
MSDSTKEAVQKQFGAHAAAFAVSAVHAKGFDLALLPGLAGLTGRETVLDVATATGIPTSPWRPTRGGLRVLI